MLSTLFHIPATVGHLPVFGFGLLLALWVLFSLGLLGYLAWRQGFTADTWSYLPLLLIVGAAIRWVLPALCDAEGLPVRSYGVMLLLAIVAATSLAAWRASRLQLHPDLVMTLIFWMFVPGIVGARAFYVIEYWPQFQRGTPSETFFAVINVAQGGLVVYGSLIGGLLGIVAFCWKFRLPLLAVGDLVAPSLVLGLAIGRIGCLLNGCCYGGPCHLPWAVTFPWKSPVHFHQAHEGQLWLHGMKLRAALDGSPLIADVQPDSPADKTGLKPGQQITSVNNFPVHTVEDAEQVLINAATPGTQMVVTTRQEPTPHAWSVTEPLPRSLPVHPTQLYSTINALLLLLLLLAFEPYHRRDGELIALLLTLYSIARFLEEAIRTDEAKVFGPGLSISQTVSVFMLLVVAAMWAYIRWKKPRLAFYGQ